MCFKLALRVFKGGMTGCRRSPFIWQSSRAGSGERVIRAPPVERLKYNIRD